MINIDYVLPILGLIVWSIIMFVLGKKRGTSTTIKKWREDIKGCTEYYESLRLKYNCREIGGKHFLTFDSGETWYLVKSTTTGYEIISKANKQQLEKILKQKSMDALVQATIP